MEVEGEHTADFEEAHSSGGPRQASASPHRASGERASERAKEVPLSMKTPTCEPNVASWGDTPTVQAEHLSGLALHLCGDEELLALPQWARALLSGSLSS